LDAGAERRELEAGDGLGPAALLGDVEVRPGDERRGQAERGAHGRDGEAERGHQTGSFVRVRSRSRAWVISARARGSRAMTASLSGPAMPRSAYAALHRAGWIVRGRRRSMPR